MWSLRFLGSIQYFSYKILSALMLPRLRIIFVLLMCYHLCFLPIWYLFFFSISVLVTTDFRCGSHAKNSAALLEEKRFHVGFARVP